MSVTLGWVEERRPVCDRRSLPDAVGARLSSVRAACYLDRVLASYVDPDAAAETARYARMTPEQRLALFLQLCDLTDDVQRGRPDRSALRAPAPLDAEALALWAQLMKRR
jgi:hypothetical protein